MLNRRFLTDGMPRASCNGFRHGALPTACPAQLAAFAAATALRLINRVNAAAGRARRFVRSTEDLLAFLQRRPASPQVS